MSTSLLLQPPTASSPETAVRLTQQAPAFHSSQSSWLSFLPFPLSLFNNTESQEKWQIYENIFLASLRTGDIESAGRSLDALTARFGNSSDRVIALRGLYQEATATSDADIQAAMRSYEAVLKDDPTNFSVRKRRAALLRSAGRMPDAITALTGLLDASPTDAETWAELADCYLMQGAYEQAVFSLEEVLLVMPNAWNMHARLGEVLFLFAGRMDKGSGEQLRTLAESMRRFCRSAELCDDYLRGFYGLKLSCMRLLELLSSDMKKVQQAYSSTPAGDLPLPPLDTIKKLDAIATWRLSEIVRLGTAKVKGWDGYSIAELISARELLNRDTEQFHR